MTTLTEMIDIETERHDGVREPASGFPILMMKSTSNASGCGCCANCTKETDVAPAAKDATEEAEVETPAAETPEVTEEATKTSEPEAQAEDPKPDMAEVVKEAVAEAVKSAVEEATKGLRDELAKVKATPIPGGPVVSVPPSMRNEQAKAGQLAKAAYWADLADKTTERDLKRVYTDRAAAAKAAAGVATS